MELYIPQLGSFSFVILHDITSKRKVTLAYKCMTNYIFSVSAQTYGPALLINYMHAESLSMRMDRNLGINAFRVELLEVGCPFRDTG